MPQPSPTSVVRAIFTRGSWVETSRVSDVLRQETVSGALLLVGALLALVWANSPFAASYTAIRDFAVGTEALGLHLHLTLAQWASDGLLALFFFTVGLELKREFVAGDLRNPARAALPIAAAVGGMTVPALIFLACTAHAGAAAMRGWAVPTATDIAFAVAVLAVISTHLPSALRTFLLTLAVVDDLIAITVIAVFYTDHVDLKFLGLAVCPLAMFAVCVQRRVRAWWLLLPLGLATWSLVHASGVHATVAGVLLGFAVPVLRSAAAGGPTAGPGLAEHLEHLVRPLSAGVAVPLFAFFAAGVTVGGYRGFVEALSDPVGLGVAGGLIVGKVVGVFGTTRILASVTRASLDESLRWVDVFGMSMLAGIGFTVSLLIGELAYGLHSQPGDHVKVAVFTGSVASAVLAAVILRARNRHYRVVEAQERRDDDQDGIPDAFQSDTRGRNDSVPRAPDGVNEASMAPPEEPGVR